MKTAEKVKYLKRRGWRVDRGLSKSFGGPVMIDPGTKFETVRGVDAAYQIQVRRERRRLDRLGAIYSYSDFPFPAGWVHGAWEGQATREKALDMLESIVQRLKSRITVELRTAAR